MSVVVPAPAVNAPAPGRKCLLYYGHAPLEGAGSAIIILRHLQRFRDDGWDIRIVPDWGQDLALCAAAGWPAQQLVQRRPWWPPLRLDNILSRRLSAWLWAGETKRWLAGTRVDAILTYLSAFSDTLSIAAVGFASRYHIPLATLVHDDCRCFTPDPDEAARAHRRRQWIVEHSTKAWFASPELAACYILPPERIGLLPPIPEGGPALGAAASRPTGAAPLLVYAGNYWQPQLPVLAAISAAARSADGRLLAVLKENAADVTWLRTHGVEWRAPWPRNRDALIYYRENATALVVSYSATSDEMPWIRSSFPSKLIEYCHLGLPIMIVAPPDAAVSHWARDRKFPDAFAPGDTAGISDYIKLLRDPAFVADRAALSRSFAEGEFNPATIHRQLTDSLS